MMNMMVKLDGLIRQGLVAAVAASVILGMAQCAQAEDELIVPVAATAESCYAPRPPVATIDGSGMTPNNPVTTLSTAGHTPADGTMWLSSNTRQTWITFDLGSVETVTGFHLWNYNELGNGWEISRGVRTAGIYAGTNLLANGSGYYTAAGAAWGTLVENMTFAQGTALNTYAGSDYTFAAPVTTRYLQLYVTDNFPGADAYTGISEIRFYRSISPSAPIFTAIPQSQTVTNGNSVTFTAAATGYPEPTIAWHFIDGSSVDHLLSTVGNTLTFTSQLTDSGQYYAVASNASGITNSPSAILTVNPAPTPSAPVFTDIPQSQTIVNGDTVTFTAPATGFPQPFITWHFVDASYEDHLLAMVGDTLTFKVHDARAGEYYAVASNASGTTNSPSALLTVTSTGVDDVLIKPAAATALSYYAAATDVRSPEKAIDGSGMTPNNPATDSSVCSTTGEPEWLCSTKYTWITFDLGSVQTITGFHLWNANQSGSERDRGVKTAGIYAGTNLLANGSSYTSAGAAWGTLVKNMTFAKGTGAGTYAGNIYTFDAPVTTRYLQLYVTDNYTGGGYTGISEIRFFGESFTLPSAPLFTAIPQSQTVTNGNSVTFTAPATGFPQPLITWHFVDTNSVDHLLETSGDTLTIANVHFFGDIGQYYAVASNNQGTTNSPSALLTVIPTGVMESCLSLTGGSFAPLAGNDLILGNAGVSSLSLNTDPFTGTATNLTDGVLQAPGNQGQANEVVYIMGGSVTYSLGSGISGIGYDITGIRSLTAWGDGGRINPHYTVSYSADGANFISLDTVNYTATSGANGTDVSLVIANLSKVKYIRFDFSGGQQNGGVAYSELAVFGRDTVPMGTVLMFF